MLVFFFILIFVLVLNLYWFLSRSFSPIPYFPTNQKDLDLILHTLDLNKDDLVYDLGAGTGTFIMRGALKSRAKFVGVEVNPLLILIMYLRRFFHPRKTKISLVGKDLFAADLQNATKIYLYVGPYVMKAIMTKIFNRPPKKLKKIVSYMYDFNIPKSVFPRKTIKRYSVTGDKKIYCLEFI